MPNRKPTSFDIAHRAGVSQATVSRALRDSPLVNEDTRRRVQEIARELSYQVDRSASSLRSGNTRTVALLMFEDAPGAASPINPFFLLMLGSIARACSRRDYDLLVSLQRPEEDWYARYEEAHRADGLILLGYGDYVDAHPTLKKLSDDEAHWILWGPQLELEGAASVGCDNRLGGYRATRHLLDKGRSRFAFLGSNAPALAPEFAARYEGHQKALEEGGIAAEDSVQVFAESSQESGRRAMAGLLDSGYLPDAIFCASDLIALGALQELVERNISVPEDVAIVGFDDIEAAAHVRPGLTTMRQDVGLAGETLVSLLLKQVEDGERSSSLLEPVLVERGSSGS